MSSVRATCSVKAKFHYTSWFGASSELASIMEFGFKDNNEDIVTRAVRAWSTE